MIKGVDLARGYTPSGQTYQSVAHDLCANLSLSASFAFRSIIPCTFGSLLTSRITTENTLHRLQDLDLPLGRKLNRLPDHWSVQDDAMPSTGTDNPSAVQIISDHGQ